MPLGTPRGKWEVTMTIDLNAVGCTNEDKWLIIGIRAKGLLMRHEVSISIYHRKNVTKYAQNSRSS